MSEPSVIDPSTKIAKLTMKKYKSGRPSHYIPIHQNFLSKNLTAYSLSLYFDLHRVSILIRTDEFTVWNMSMFDWRSVRRTEFRTARTGFKPIRATLFGRKFSNLNIYLIYRILQRYFSKTSAGLFQPKCAEIQVLETFIFSERFSVLFITKFLINIFRRRRLKLFEQVKSSLKSFE